MKWALFLIVALVIMAGFFMSQYFAQKEAAAVAKVKAEGAESVNKQFNTNQWLNAGAGALVSGIGQGLNQLFKGSATTGGGGTSYGGYSF